jgi:hypothetical protein
MEVRNDGRAWYAWRRTITGWALGIGAPQLHRPTSASTTATRRLPVSSIRSVTNVLATVAQPRDS